MIKSVKIKIGNVEAELTVEEVKKLRDDLDALLGQDKVQFIPISYPSVPTVPFHWIEHPWRPAWEITCGTSGNPA